MGQGQEAHKPHRRGRDRQPGQRAVGARPSPRSATSSTRSSTSTSPTISNEPLAWTHNRVEGRQEYTQLLYLPAQRAVRSCGTATHRHGIKLYVRRVFIMDDAEQLLPAYLRFVRGVVDSSDLPLNVSREILQESRDIEAIRAGCTKRVLALLEDLAHEPARTSTPDSGRSSVWCSRRASARTTPTRRRSPDCCALPAPRPTPRSRVSLADYVARMKPGQEKIYYVTADTLAAPRRTVRISKCSARRAWRCCC